MTPAAPAAAILRPLADAVAPLGGNGLHNVLSLAGPLSSRVDHLWWLYFTI